jgi:lipopolysaccharide export system protein LptA
LFGPCLGQTTELESDVVHIKSDRFEAYQIPRQLVFIGNVVATQGELTIRSERLTIVYLDKKNSEAADINLAGRIDRVEVDGNVRITQKEILATGEHAVYFDRENKVVLTGKPRVERGKDFIQGEKITLFLDSEKSVVEGGPSGPVEATIYSSTSGGVVD